MATDERLERYAELTVKVGCNLQPGQELGVMALVEHAPLARAVSRSAYRAGAAYVHLHYMDMHVQRALIEYGPDDAQTRTPAWLQRWIDDLGEKQAGFVAFRGDPEPELLADLDGERVGRARMQKLDETAGRLINESLINWTVVASPNEGWARSAFGEPDVERLWAAVALATRLDEPDPVGAWREHIGRLEERTRRLDELAFDAIRFRGPGTELTVGLLPGSRWQGAGECPTSGAMAGPKGWRMQVLEKVCHGLCAALAAGLLVLAPATAGDGKSQGYPWAAAMAAKAS